MYFRSQIRNIDKTRQRTMDRSNRLRIITIRPVVMFWRVLGSWAVRSTTHGYYNNNTTFSATLHRCYYRCCRIAHHIIRFSLTVHAFARWCRWRIRAPHRGYGILPSCRKSARTINGMETIELHITDPEHALKNYCRFLARETFPTVKWRVPIHIEYIQWLWIYINPWTWPINDAKDGTLVKQTIAAAIGKYYSDNNIH